MKAAERLVWSAAYGAAFADNPDRAVAGNVANAAVQSLAEPLTDAERAQMHPNAIELFEKVRNDARG